MSDPGDNVHASFLDHVRRTPFDEDDPVHRAHDFAFTAASEFLDALQAGRREVYHDPQETVVAAAYVVRDVRRMLEEWEPAVRCRVDGEMEALVAELPRTGGRVVAYFANPPSFYGRDEL